MDSKPASLNRSLAGQPIASRLYLDNHDELMALCERTGRKPAEEVRDLIDEALTARRQPPLDGTEISERFAQLLERNTKEKEAVSRHMREFYGLLLETLSASLGARNIAWSYLAQTVLQQSGLSAEQIRARYEAECKAGAAERDAIADALEAALIGLPPVK